MSLLGTHSWRGYCRQRLGDEGRPRAARRDAERQSGFAGVAVQPLADLPTGEGLAPLAP